jgi:hypothetical protein
MARSLLLMAVKYDLPTEALSQRSINRARRAGNLAAAKHFVAEMLGRRFDGSVAVEAGWAKRDVRYAGWKMKNRGGNTPHVKTGRTKSAATRATTKVALKRITIIIPGASRGYDGRTTRGGVNLKAELRRVLPRETKVLSQVWKEAYEASIAKEIATPTRRGRKAKGGSR